jgi:imidazole glycerol-phosphate synthase subunit HisH
VIALVDYGAGNLTSVKKALAAVGARVFVPADADHLARASGIVVPGVGHFGATRALGDAWLEGIRAHIAAGRPLLGICLGMQWLFAASEEAPDVRGIGIFPGSCTRLDSNGTPPVKVPHVGWNDLCFCRRDWIADGIADGTQVYFTHSYAAPLTDDLVASAEHGSRFAAIVQRDNVTGVQFHPEKSGDAGLRILRNFARHASS